MLKITPRLQNNKRRSMLMEQVLVFIVSFVSLYGIILFTSMRSKSGNLMDDFAKNQWPFIVGGLMCAAGINLIYYFVQRSKTHIVSVEFNDCEKLIVLETRKKYSEDLSMQVVPYVQLKYHIRKHKAFFLGYNYSIISFFDNKKLIGGINTSENWDGEALAIRNVLDGLKNAGQRRP